MVAPPESPPRVGQADDDDRHQLRVRIWLVTVTVLTILVTGWLVRLGPIPAILALVVAKHILVAILVMGLGVDQRRQAL